MTLSPTMSPAADVAPTSRQDHRIAPVDAADMILRHRAGILPALALFDVRDAASYAKDRIDGAVHLGEAGFPAAMSRLPRTTPILIYCYHGNASRTYAQWFADFRYPEVYSVDGGHPYLTAALETRLNPCDPPAVRDSSSAGLVTFLQEYGFDPQDLDTPRQHGLTPLMRAALLGDAALINELLALGADPARRNMDGNNALWLACVSSSAAAVRALVDAGIDIDNRNDMGATCLMYTASAGKDDMVALLLECGANPLLTNFDDARAVDLAATRACLQLLRHTAG